MRSRVGVVLSAGLLVAQGTLAYVGSKSCGTCHKAIYDTYSRTPMALSSGVPGEGIVRESFDAAKFKHAASGFQYRVYADQSGLAFGFANADGSRTGTKRLTYYVGSGAIARSYVIADDGFLYEAPVAYYGDGKRWGLAPAYDAYAYPYLTRPVTPACLTCHASFLTLVANTQNRYNTPPFRESGVACERCHGAGEDHIAHGGAAGIINPAKLSPEARDSICSQCHVSGAVRIFASGKDWQSYHPGGRLFDSIKVFVKAGGTAGVTVTGHVEKLAESRCQRESKQRMWCGTCHDPHSVPKASERAMWFRNKCFTCHTTESCTESLAARRDKQDDCTACHMPKGPTVDAQHVVYTDHSIPRRPVAVPAQQQAVRELAPFGGAAASDRDLALAYAILAQREHTPPDRAIAMLEKAEQASPNDTEVLLYLAELYRNGGRPELAVPLYERAIKLDAAQVTASVGLGGIFMERGLFAQAIPFWEDALSKNSGLVLVRSNLAMAYWRTGDLDSAETHLLKVLKLSPGFAPAADLLARLRHERIKQ